MFIFSSQPPLGMISGNVYSFTLLDCWPGSSVALLWEKAERHTACAQGRTLSEQGELHKPAHHCCSLISGAQKGCNIGHKRHPPGLMLEDWDDGKFGGVLHPSLEKLTSPR
jgi:hypothetical protein